MIDKYDVFYGITDQTKQKISWWISSLLVSLVILFWFKDKQEFLQLNLPTNMKEFYLLLVTIFVLGLFLYMVILMVFLLAEIIHFKRRDKKLLIKTKVLNNQQKEKILKKIFIRKEVYSIILKPDENNYGHLTAKQWKFYNKKVGTRQELLSRMKFLNYIEYKIKEEESLKDIEIDYLNDLLFTKEDVNLVKKIQKDIKK